MKYVINRILTIALISLIVSSCATTPVVQVPQPWTRSLGSPQSIEMASTFYISVNGQENHLLIDNTLLDEGLYKNIESQLIRRGFEVTEDAQSADQRLVVSYSTREVQEMSTELVSFQNSRQTNYSGASTGVLVASAVGAQAANVTTTTEAKTLSQTAYKHTIGLSIIKRDDQLLWTGESTWTGSSLDIRGRFNTASQILLSNLPGYGEIIPRVPAVNPDKKENYFKLYVEGNYFVGPALPYAISFEIASERGSLLRDQTYDITGLSNPRITAAVMDLIETAEYAVPRVPDLDNPISVKQWNRVKLGGAYYIGDDSQPTNILVELRGNDYGYTIQSAIVANRQEYRDFQNDLERWQNALRDYYDVFE